MSPRRRLAGVVLAACLAASCARALREPLDPTELHRGPAAAPSEAETLALQAATLYEQRTVESVREAAELWSRAAATQPRVPWWIGAVKARVWLVEHEDDPTIRRSATAAALSSAQWCQRTDPQAPACDYWLAVALGVQARERRATGLDALPRIVDLLEQTIERDPGLEHGGPHRVLALVLLRAPGWPLGPGDPDRGLEQARRAVELDPDYPPNQLCLAEALAATGDERDSRWTYERAAVLAREALAHGTTDAAEWLQQAEAALGRAPAESTSK